MEKTQTNIVGTMKKYPKPLFGFLDPISICVCVCVCVCVEVEGGTFPHYHQAIFRTPAECHTIQLHSNTLTTCTQHQIPQDKS